MPSTTFYNLSSQKREALLTAAKKEFARVPYGSASINQIVREAGISRGSFYMYFDGKEDLLIYLLQDFVDSLLQAAQKTLLETQGDLFSLPLLLYDFVLNHCKDDRSTKFLCNISAFIREKSNASSPEAVMQELAPDFSPHTFSNLIDQSRLNVRTRQDLKDMFSILLSVTLNDLALTLLDPQQRYTARAHLTNKIQLLRQGLERKLPVYRPEGDPCYV